MFVPLFGVFAADYFVRHGGRYGEDALFERSGVRWRAFVPWAAGFVVYHWCVATGPTAWVDAVRTVLADWLSLPYPLFGSRLGASLPSFVVAFALGAAAPAARAGLLADGARGRGRGGDHQDDGRLVDAFVIDSSRPGGDERALPLVAPLAAPVDLHDDPAGHDEDDGVRVGVRDRAEALVAVQAHDLRPEAVGLEQRRVTGPVLVEVHEIAQVTGLHGCEAYRARPARPAARRPE